MPYRSCLLLRPSFLLFLAALGFGFPDGSGVAGERSPNVLLIVADDLGFSDPGCYGGEIETPHLDRLAKNGLRLTQFYTTGRCCPSRASLLTGRYPHAVGLGHMTQDLGRPGYRGSVSENVTLLPQQMNANGYRSFLSGKWHLGTDDPTAKGFEEFYGTLVSAKTFWEPDHFTRLPAQRTRLPHDAETFYGTDALADYALQFLDEARTTPEKPWFLYLAFNAPHFPLHAPPETIAKYAERYSAGWDSLRAERLTRMKQLGIVPDSVTLTPRSEFYDWGEFRGVANPAWETLPQPRRVDLARRMAIYAAMVDRMDQNIGRVLKNLEELEELDDTLIIFTSDNGACAEWDPFGFDGRSGPKNVLHTGGALDRMGSRGTFHSAGSGWANASNTPWRLYKHYTHEGGIAVPCIVHWPNGLQRQPGEIDATPAHLIDIFPTLVDALHTDEPTTEPASLPGTSLLPLLSGEPLPKRLLFFEHEGNRGVRAEKWKLVALRNKPWELYDLEADRTELEDRAGAKPNLVQRLSRAWDRWAENNNVTPLPDDYRIAYVPANANVTPAAVGPVKKLADGFRFTEGPAWAGNGVWYFSDIPNKTLHRYTPAKGVELVRTGEQASNGIVIDDEGRLVFCEVGGRRVVRRDATGNEVTLADAVGDRTIGMPNDLWLAPDGAIYFTIPKTNKRRAKVVPPDAVNGTVCRIAPDGKTIVDVGLGLKSCNGVVGTRDGKTLYVADPASRSCFRYRIRPDGTLTDQTLAADKGSDGLAVDEFGNLYTTAKEGVVIFSPEAKQIGTIPMPESPANLKFGGTDRRTLFVTARTGIYEVTMNVRGN